MLAYLNHSILTHEWLLLSHWVFLLFFIPKLVNSILNALIIVLTFSIIMLTSLVIPALRVNLTQRQIILWLNAQSNSCTDENLAQRVSISLPNFAKPITCNERIATDSNTFYFWKIKQKQWKNRYSMCSLSDNYCFIKFWLDTTPICK